MEHDLNREVGEIKAQMRWMTQNIHEIKINSKDIAADVKQLLVFKWRIAGFAGFAAFLATAVIEFMRRG